MQTIDTIHIRRLSMQPFAPSYPVQTQAFPISAAPISPLKPTTKTKKNRKPKSQPVCPCPDCTKQSNPNGVFYCFKGKEYVIFSAGQFLGYRSIEIDAASLLREHRYTSLTKL